MNLSRLTSIFQNIDFTSTKTILFFALIVRLIAAIFSQGYGMHDDHFLVIEASSSWADGNDYNRWLPWTEGSRGIPEGHSFTYVGLNYLFFAVFKWFGFTDPKLLMLFNRLIHALISISVVHFGMKITEKISNRKNAVTVGWLLALLWVMPFLAVRNLVETAAIPFLVWGVWLILKSDKGVNFLWAGLLVGLSVSFRYQIGVFAIGIAAYYFFTWKWVKFLLFCLGILLMFALTQGIVDYFIWGYPFAEMISYVTYNMNEGMGYAPNSNYLMYFYVLMGTLLFPLGLLALVGFFRSSKKHLLLFIPTLLFIIFHTIYPNRQERFILSILPFFIILGVIGYHKLREIKLYDKLWSVSMKLFWVLNIPLLLFATFTYSKKSRVEAMYYFNSDGYDTSRILLEGSTDSKPSLLPRYYAGTWDLPMVERTDSTQTLSVCEGCRYDYILFFGQEQLDERITEYKELYPELKLVKVCDPSLVDKVLRWLNDRNSNQYIEIWQTGEPRS
jgi:hypothetical protein